MYNFGERPCKIEFDDFLCITTDIKRYKSDFNDFSSLYEFIEKNIKKITHILFNNYEYYLEKGVLHNLYGPALTRHNNDKITYGQGTSNYYFIDGKIIYNTKDGDRGCKSLLDFQHKEIFQYKELTTPQSRLNAQTGKIRRPQEGIDYIRTFINLEQRIKLDQRKKKLKFLNDL